MPDDNLAKLVADAKEIIGMAEVPRVSDPLAEWRGEFGNEYLERCSPTAAEITARAELWREILRKMPIVPRRILEVGANQGQNLEALHTILPEAVFMAVEPNEKARARIPFGMVKDGTAQAIPFPPNEADLVFTSGVLIHIDPAELLKACQEIYRVSARYIVAVEYFNPVPTEMVYRGHGGALWKRDFGGFYLDNFPDLKPLAAGFSWKRMTGLDDVHWFVFEKSTAQVYNIQTDEYHTVTRRA